MMNLTSGRTVLQNLLLVTFFEECLTFSNTFNNFNCSNSFSTVNPDINASFLGFCIRIFIRRRIIFNLDTKFICILWGSLSIAFAITKIVTAAINMTHQPLLNTVITILSIIEIVFSILLIIRTLDSLHEHMVFIGIALIVEAVTLLIEFLIHRYQR